VLAVPVPAIRRATQAIKPWRGRHTPQVAAAAAVRDLFERLGCVVVDVEAQTHDRKVADLHALAFFVARGIVEPGINVDEPFSSSSFQAMATTVRTPSDLQ
jgi:prephenate dehydrogenase